MTCFQRFFRTMDGVLDGVLGHAIFCNFVVLIFSLYTHKILCVANFLTSITQQAQRMWYIHLNSISVHSAKYHKICATLLFLVFFFVCAIFHSTIFIWNNCWQNISSWRRQLRRGIIHIIVASRLRNFIATLNKGRDKCDSLLWRGASIHRDLYPTDWNIVKHSIFLKC